MWNNTATGNGAGNWSTASNWSPAAVPTSASNAQISNGGEAIVTTTIAASRIEVGKNNGIGTLTSTTAGIEIIIDSDFDIGEIGGDFATGPVTATGNGTVNISNAARLLIGDSGAGDLDLGQTNATSGAQANGIGSLSLTSVALVDIIDDADVGQAGGTATAIANGEFNANAVDMLNIGADFDIGQSGGTGESSATGISSITNSNVVVGSDIDVGRTTGSSIGNSGDGTLLLTDSTLSTGFADNLTPGSINIGDSGATTGQLANSLGSITITRSSIDVADRINIGGLTGGSANSQNSSNGTLHLVDSMASTDKLNIASITLGTQGTATGLLQIDSSLIDIDGALTMGDGGSLKFGLAGDTRSDGSGSAGQYGAILADSAVLSGDLAVHLLDGFEPTAGNQFDLLTTTNLLSGSLLLDSLPALNSGLDWSLSQTSNLLRLEVIQTAVNADFDSDSDVDGVDFLTWQRNAGLNSGANLSQGDADGDGDVDEFDLAAWKSQFGVPLALSQTNASSVPEPTSASLATLLAAVLAFCVRSKHVRSSPFGGRSTEP